MAEEITTQSIYARLADLLDYPREGCPSLIESCGELVSGESPEISDAFTNFREGVVTLSLSELQEVYTRTFDLSPVCALDIGYHLFGENYKRGVFLANLRETEAPFDLGQEHQLPDYLPVLLRLVARLEDEELRGSLISECLIPALEKMLKTLSEGENPYRHLIAAVNAVLKSEGLPQAANPCRAYLPILDDAGWNHAPAPQARQMVAPGVSPGITIERLGGALEEGDIIA
jgi:nitrate reductase molybdenum cofactor assembly chaperone